jgi:hypothetical protein
MERFYNQGNVKGTLKSAIVFEDIICNNMH